jgi:hypothetical protein
MPGSLASRVLEVICAWDGWINSTQIKKQIGDVDEIAKISAALHDLWEVKKVNRQLMDGRLCYCARQLEIFPGAAEDLQNRESHAPAIKQAARHMTTRATKPRRKGMREVSDAAKLRTLDLVIGFVAEDMARVLRAIRADLVSGKRAAA